MNATTSSRSSAIMKRGSSSSHHTLVSHKPLTSNSVLTQLRTFVEDHLRTIAELCTQLNKTGMQRETTTKRTEDEQSIGVVRQELQRRWCASDSSKFGGVITDVSLLSFSYLSSMNKRHAAQSSPHHRKQIQNKPSCMAMAAPTSCRPWLESLRRVCINPSMAPYLSGLCLRIPLSC